MSVLSEVRVDSYSSVPKLIRPGFHDEFRRSPSGCARQGDSGLIPRVEIAHRHGTRKLRLSAAEPSNGARQGGRPAW